MKIEIEAKDAPKYQRVERVTVDTHLHSKVHVQTLIRAVKLNRPWCKIIDIRIDLR